MGQLFSGPYHRAELQMRKSNQVLDYQPQPPEEILQLDTEVDQRGNTTVDHVFKQTRDVYGQKAQDLKFRALDWREYGIELKKRPSPYEFPAFEHEERNREKLEVSASKATNEKGPATVANAAKNATVLPSEKHNASKKTKAMDVQSTTAKDKHPGKRLAQNQELDRCSLDED
ncbi:hypothetical protein M3Y97_00421400 [Aphelenchoides bicaudatus]|nr:hypothetical protein M3Y97_00421400 [Aphelenchoides bicaudatus]